MIEEIDSAQYVQHYFEKAYKEVDYSPEAFLRAALEFVQREAGLLTQPDAGQSLARLVQQVIAEESPMTSPDTNDAKEAAHVAVMDSATDSQAAKPAPVDVDKAASQPTAAATQADASQLPDAAEDVSTCITPNAGNGADLPTYSWTQTLSEVLVTIPIPAGTKGRACDVSITRNNLRAGLRGQTPVLSGSLFAAVQPDDCLWNVVDGCVLEITLQKIDRMQWWRAVIQGEREIDTQKVEPESSKLEDLDLDTRATVEKMMYDQRQRALGLPTSEEQQKQEILKQFMAHHPEMDFSNAKLV